MKNCLSVSYCNLTQAFCWKRSTRPWRKAMKFVWSALAHSVLLNALRPKAAIRVPVPRSKFRLPNSRNSKRVKVWKMRWTKTGFKNRQRRVRSDAPFLYTRTIFPIFPYFFPKNDSEKRRRNVGLSEQIFRYFRFFPYSEVWKDAFWT